MMTSNFDEMTLEAIWNEIDVRLKEKPELYKVKLQLVGGFATDC